MHRSITSIACLAALGMPAYLAGTSHASAGTTATPMQYDDVPLIPRELLFGNPERAGVRVSPDGKWLSYLAPRDEVLNIWIEPVDGGEARPITKATRPIGSYSWAWNGEQILYTQDQNGDENTHVYAVDLETMVVTDLTPWEGAVASIAAQHRDRPDEILVITNARNPQNMDLRIVNTRTGAAETHFQNDEGFLGMIPDDTWTVRATSKMREDGGTDVMVRDDADGAWYTFAEIAMEDSMTTSPGGFSKDGSILYMVDSRDRDKAALVAYKPKGGVVGDGEVLFASDKADLSDALANPITEEPEAVAVEYLRQDWHFFDAAIEAEFKALAALADGDVEVTSRSADDRKWTVAYLQDDGPVKYYLWDRDAQAGRFLFTNRPELDDAPLVPMKGVEITARDGLVLPAYLTRPMNQTEAGPMVLLVHGGPWARDSWGYNPYHQWLANRGYAVLSVNFRGSTGFGKDFINAGNREWAGKMQDDLVDAVKWAVDQNIAVADQVGIMGGSYGGYATLVGMTDTPELFACGVDIVGPSHVGTLLSTIPAYWQPMVDMFKSRVGGLDEPEWLDKISPLTRVDQIKRPLLIGQGQNDPRVKVSESDQIVAAMKEAGLPVTYVVFPDEGHGFDRPVNNQAFNGVTEVFLAEHLGGRAEPISDAIAKSTAQVRSIGDLDLPGVTEYVPGPEAEPVPDAVVAYDDLTDAQKARADQILGQLEQAPAGMLPQIKQQLEAQRGQVPEADLPAFLYVLQTVEAKIKAGG